MSDEGCQVPYGGRAGSSRVGAVNFIAKTDREADGTFAKHPRENLGSPSR